MVLFLLATTTACTLLLSAAQLAYVRAATVFNRRLYATILGVFEITASRDDVEGVFEEHFAQKQVGAATYYVSKTRAPGTVVFKAEGAGLWSRIELLLAVSPDGRRLHAMRVLSQAETPGLGGRIGEPEFQARFTGVTVRPCLEVVKFAMADNQVDAISGATRTSQAVQSIVNRGVAEAGRAFGRWE